MNRSGERKIRRWPVVILFLLLPGLVFPGQDPDTLQLELTRAVYLESSGAFNLSGLALSEDGWLYFCDDNGPAPPDWTCDNPVILRVPLDSVLRAGAAVPELEPVELVSRPDAFAAVAEQTGKVFKYDFEGIEVAAPGRLWLVDERDRLLLEFNLASKMFTCIATPEVLIQHREDLSLGRINNGFEGITRIGSRLFLAHEMMPALIVSMHLDRDFEPAGAFRIEGGYDITDLDSDRGSLYALGRTGSLVYKIDPESGKTLAAASFRKVGDSRRYRYVNRREFYRNSEGLVVKGGHILVVLDGNFQRSLEDSTQRAPLLLVFKRPENF